MTRSIELDDDLDQFLGDPPTYLWTVASMTRWHLAVPHRTGKGIASPCGAGGVPTVKALHWRGASVVAREDVSTHKICTRCKEMSRDE